jgi:hypothetical protein
MSRLMELMERWMPWAVKDGKPSWLVKYVTASVLILLACVIVFHRFLGLDAISYTTHVGVATILAVVGIIGVGVALMAAVFYSSRSGMDDDAR